MLSQVSSNPTKSETYGLGVKMQVDATSCYHVLLIFPTVKCMYSLPCIEKYLLFCAEAVVTLVGIRRPIYPTAVARQTLAICVILTPGMRIITNFSVRELPYVKEISAIYLIIYHSLSLLLSQLFYLLMRCEFPHMWKL